MAKENLVALVDPSSGALVDYNGNNRENGKFRAFAGRLMSHEIGGSVSLDYGKAGGDRLNICCNGKNGASVDIKAARTNVSGDLYVGGKKVPDADNVATLTKVARLAYGITITGEETTAELAGKLRILLDRIGEIAGGES